VLAKSAQMTEIHPLQDEHTVQGMLEILHVRVTSCVRYPAWTRSASSRSGRPGRADRSVHCARYHRASGQDGQRDQIITTIHSHPVDAACPAAMGYEVITLWPMSRAILTLAP